MGTINGEKNQRQEEAATMRLWLKLAECIENTTKMLYKAF